MKMNIFVQQNGHELNLEDAEKQAKKYWKMDGHKLGEIQTLDLYVKPEEFAVYYSINDDEQKGRIAF